MRQVVQPAGRFLIGRAARKPKPHEAYKFRRQVEVRPGETRERRLKLEQSPPVCQDEDAQAGTCSTLDLLQHLLDNRRWYEHAGVQARQHVRLSETK